MVSYGDIADFAKKDFFQKGHGAIWRHMAILLYRLTLESLEGITGVTTEPPLVPNEAI